MGGLHRVWRSILAAGNLTPSPGTAPKVNRRPKAVILSAAKDLFCHGTKRSFAALRMTSTCVLVAGAAERFSLGSLFPPSGLVSLAIEVHYSLSPSRGCAAFFRIFGHTRRNPAHSSIPLAPHRPQRL